MKIIAKTENGFLLEASKDEVANLLGEYSHYHLKADVQEKLKIGATIRINKMYERITNLDHKNKNVKAAITALRDMLELFAESEPIIDKAMSKQDEKS